jgi:hypothetical protein
MGGRDRQPTPFEKTHPKTLQIVQTPVAPPPQAWCAGYSRAPAYRRKTQPQTGAYTLMFSAARSSSEARPRTNCRTRGSSARLIDRFVPS